MKLVYLLLLVFFVNVALIATGVSTGTINSLFTFLSNPLDWDNNPLSASVVGVLTITGALIVAGALLFRNAELLWYALGAELLASGSPLIDFFTYIKSSIGGDMGLLIATIIVSPMILAYIMIVVYWVRGRD